jgi:hypothetical protein
MITRELNFLDKTFYWARSGKQATVIELSCSLAEDVDPQALKVAATKALGVHTNFRIRPLIVGNGVKAVIDDVKIPPVYPTAERSPSARRSIRISRL